MTINSFDEWGNAIEDAEQVMLRWGHGQVRRIPDEVVAVIVAALRATTVSERGASTRLLLDQVRRDWYRFTGYSQLKADIDFYLDESHERKDS